MRLPKLDSGAHLINNSTSTAHDGEVIVFQRKYGMSLEKQMGRWTGKAIDVH